MKVPKNSIEKFIKNILTEKIKGVFLYGDELSIIHDRMQNIKNSFLDYETVKIDLNEQAASVLFNESFTSSLFNSKKIIIVSGDVETKFNDTFNVFSRITQDCTDFFIIAFEGSLDGRSKLRKFFENSDIIACIACYLDEEFNIVPIIQTFFKENNLIADAETIEYISKTFKGNRGILFSELAKLKSYKIEGRITILEAKFVMEEQRDTNIFQAVNHFFNFSDYDFFKTIDILKNEGIPASAIILAIINYTFKLLEIVEEKMSKPESTIETILNEKFVFFKQIPLMKKQLLKWDIQKLNNLCLDLVNDEIKARQNSEVSKEILALLFTKYKIMLTGSKDSL